MIRRIAVVVVVLALGAGACSDDSGSAGGSDADWLGGVAHDVAVPAYEALDAALTGLAEASGDGCSSGDVDAVTSAWVDARDAWERAQAVGIGPAMDLRLSASVDFDADPAKVMELAAGTDPVDAESLAGLGADVRGLGAVELLVVAPDQEMDAIDPVRRCAYAEGAALSAATTTGEVLAAWTDGVDGGDPFVDQLSDPGSSIDNTSLLLNQVVAVTRMTALDVGRAESAAGAPEDLDDSVPEGPAGRFLDDVAARLDGVAAVLGDLDDGTGLVVAIAGQSDDAGERVLEQMTVAQEAVAALPRPLSDALVSDPVGVGDVAAATAALTATLNTEVASLLGVTIGLGDADGDS